MKSIFKRLSLILFTTFFITTIQAQTKYSYTIDLTKVENDQIKVSLKTPVIKTDTVLFHLPKIVPGTYAIHNYGSFVQNLKAYGKNNDTLIVTKVDKNSWQIVGSKNLSRLEYWVDDTWDTPSIDEDIFEPAGTNIAKDSLFVINSFGFFGYFKEMLNLSFEISIKRPKHLFAATSLNKVLLKGSVDTDMFTAKSYHFLADAPIMYAPADTAYLQISKTKVLIAVHSPNKVLNAKDVAKELQPILKAQEQYLKGQLPVNNYAFIIHLSDNKALTRYGALEHSYSSFYYLPEFMSKGELIASLKDAATHEFFHIQTPLNVHSEEIGNFDYINPQMSEHLWLYEGLTEYAAHHAQVKGKLIDEKEYLNRLASKLNVANNQFNDTLPFTQLSKYTLTKYKNQYMNVYQKGALIGACLDIQLRSFSGGNYGTQNLMFDLSKKYGKSKSFKDNELFAEIGKLTNISIEQFLKTYVDGNKQIPYDSIFNLVGLIYNPNDTIYEPQIEMRVDFALIPNTDTLHIQATYRQTKLGKRLGFKSGDKILLINDNTFNLKTYQEVFQNYTANTKVGDTVKCLVLRKNDKGIWEEKFLEAIIQNEAKKVVTLKHNDKATAKQKETYQQWLIAK